MPVDRLSGKRDYLKNTTFRIKFRVGYRIGNTATACQRKNRRPLLGRRLVFFWLFAFRPLAIVCVADRSQ